ncbi:MAG: hypothetical protein HYX87_08590 [Chloroflexi bacterium]|nr:hypothetical protein [Chloroflexota bacterium]
MVTQTLTSVGFELEWRWVEMTANNQKVKKRARAYCIPDARTWSEIISRYYYAEDGETPLVVPEVLVSQRFSSAPGTVPSVSPGLASPGNNGHGTDGTLGTLPHTGQKEHNHGTVGACSLCGADAWSRRNGGWICAGCQASPEGEVL